MQCKDDILPTIRQFETYRDEVEDILENFDPDEITNDIWNELAAQEEQNKTNKIVMM